MSTIGGMIMSKKGKRSVPVVMKKNSSSGKIYVGTVGGVESMLHAAGKPWRSGSSVAHNNKRTNPKNIRRDAKIEIKKEGW